MQPGSPPDLVDQHGYWGSHKGRDAGTWPSLAWRRPRTSPPFWSLLGTLLFCAPISSAGPTVGIDASWVTGINIASSDNLLPGRDLIYTYGPLGWLDYPLITSRSHVALGAVFGLIVLAVYWAALWRAFSALENETLRAVLSSVLTVATASLALPPTALLVAGAGFLSYHQIVEEWHCLARLNIALPVSGGLTLLVKFSDGVALVAIALLFNFASYRRRGAGPMGLRLLESLTIGTATFSCLWFVISSSFGGLGRWLIGSYQLSEGYSEAMGYEYGPTVLYYLIALPITAFILLFVLKRTAELTFWPRVGAVLIAVAAIYLGWKEGFVRDDEHRNTLFMTLIPLIASTWEIARLRRFTVVGLIACVATAGVGIEALNPASLNAKWAGGIQVLLNKSYQTSTLQAAASANKTGYAIPQNILDRVGTNSVSVDPWETTAVWTYKLNWRPPPVFQTYAAYTASLDRTNAQYLRQSTGSQFVIRQLGAQIDYRNPLWDSPDYNRVLACEYRPVLSNSAWLLLQKGQNRCGPSEVIEEAKVRRGSTLPLPDVGTDNLLTMAFSPTGGSLLVKLADTAFKDFRHLEITCNQAEFRLPRAFTPRQLLISIPASFGWPEGYSNVGSCTSLIFNTPGTVTFFRTPTK